MSLVILLIMCCIYGLEVDPQGVLFYLFLVVCLYTIYQGLLQATTMKVIAFATSLILSLLAVAGVSILITVMLKNGVGISPYVVIGALVIVLDAVVSPIIAFKMALRNFLVVGT